MEWIVVPSNFCIYFDGLRSSKNVLWLFSLTEEQIAEVAEQTPKYNIIMKVED